MVEAEQLLSNPLILEAFNSAEADLMAQLYAVKLSDTEAHTRLVLALQTSRCINRYLWGIIQDGISARDEINMRGRRID